MVGFVCRCRYVDWECAFWVIGDGNEVVVDIFLEKLEKGMWELRLRGGVILILGGMEKERFILEWVGKVKELVWFGLKGYFLVF